MIFNTHSHINDENITNVDELITNAKNLNVGYVAVIGTDVKSSLKAIEIATHYNNIYAVCGLHPSDLDSFDDNYEPFIKMWNNDNVIGIGEIGLDYYYPTPSKEKQLFYFEKFLQLATKVNKPVIIHCRDSYLDTFNLLEKYHKELNGIIMHCYSGSVEMMERFLKLGCYISISGTVTFKNAKEIKEVAKKVPVDRLLVETDDPYLTPVPYRGKTNQPAYVYYVIEEIAKLKEMNLKELIDITTNNAKRVFNLWLK